METIPMTEDPPSQETAYLIGRYPAVNQNTLLLTRALAIQAYATLEFSLSTVFAQWLGTSVDVGGLVFFRITNAHARNRILDDLKKKRLESNYNLFWNSLLSLIRTIDQRRNEIVHWHIVNNIDLSIPHEQASKLTLNPPTGWGSGAGTSINEQELAEFILKCDFVSRAIVMFSAIGTDRAVDLDEVWLNIFQQPITYPPPGTHPLSPKYSGSESPPQRPEA